MGFLINLVLLGVLIPKIGKLFELRAYLDPFYFLALLVDGN
jgi:hypothetical protein